MSADAAGEAEQYVIHAIELGIPIIGFSDHFDFNPIDRSFGCYDYDAASNAVDGLRKKYGAEIEILLGVEITYETPFYDDIVTGLAGKAFDYVIGSIHYVDGIMVSERSSIAQYEERDVSEVYGVYFREMLNMLKSGLVDIVGHFDLCKRYGVEVYGPFSEEQVPDGLVKRCLQKMIADDIALEVNTSGYRQLPKEPYPGETIIHRYLELGGRLIVTGSDTHDVVNIGAGLGNIRDLLRRLGVDTVYIYEKQQTVFYEI